MPKVFSWNGFRFHFFANEGDPREPPHVHVTRAGATAEFRLSSDVELACNRGYDARTAKRLREVIALRRAEIEEARDDYFA